jgi:hypothetical protein
MLKVCFKLCYNLQNRKILRTSIVWIRFSENDDDVGEVRVRQDGHEPESGFDNVDQRLTVTWMQQQQQMEKC